MELRHLKHFIAVGEAGSITAAAKLLRMTQPALSRQMKGLEEELDLLLLERGAQSITLTTAGEILMDEARKLVSDSEAMVEKVKASALGQPLRVGYAPSLAGEFLSVAIERFTQFHPRVRVNLYDCSSAELLSKLADGKLDMIISAPDELVRPEVTWLELKRYHWRLVMPAQHPLAKKRKIATQDLAGERLLLFEKEQYPEYWKRILGFFKAHQLQAKVAGEFDGVSSLTSALEGNLGVALLSESSPIDRSSRSRLISRPLVDEPDAIRVAAGIPASKPCVAQVLSFIEELKVAAAEVSR